MNRRKVVNDLEPKGRKTGGDGGTLRIEVVYDLQRNLHRVPTALGGVDDIRSYADIMYIFLPKRLFEALP